MSKEVDLFDIDGLIVNRQIPIQGGALKGYIRHGVAIYDRRLSIPDLSRDVDTSRIRSPKEALSYFFHARRGVKSGVVEFMRSRNSDKFGNTGRKNKEQWVKMTRNQLLAQGVTQLNDIFFTPKGIETVVSKGAAINVLQEQYNHVTHYDDDPLTVLILAKHFSDVDFVLVEDLSTRFLLSGVHFAEYKNVTVVSNLRDLA